ncbi:MAG: DHH family phosphoesterase, partial [Myxococcota bacterium]|nr:DHH family phosphoesterase [Myxococcota bacterium]
MRESGGDSSSLAAALGVSPLLAHLLTLRDVGDPDQAQAFLGAGLADLPDPAGMTDLELAAARLADACQGGQRVIVHGDYDVDGVVSTSLTTELLRRLGAAADSTLPHRTRDGYGISAEQVAGYADRGYDLLVCCDCGVTAHG